MKNWFKRTWARFKAWFVSILVAIGLAAAPLAMSAPKDFSWSNAAQRVDGSAFDPATEQAEVRIYCDGDTAPTFVSPGASNTFTGEFAFGSHTCHATTVDQYGLESDPSNSVTFVVTPARPNPPVLNVN